MFRRKTTTPGPIDAKDSPGSRGTTDAEIASEDQQRSSTAQIPAPSTSAAIDAEWNEAIAVAKTKTTFVQKLKRIGSKGKASKPLKEKLAFELPEMAEEDIAANIPLPPDGKSSAGVSDGIPGANTLSRRIQVLMSNVPPFYHTVPATDPSGTTAGGSNQGGLTDSTFLSYLSSPEIMNGTGNGSESVTTSTPGKPRKSVWIMLNQLLPYKPPIQAPPSKDGEDPTEEASETSLMLYGPLIPGIDSKVELASSEVIEVAQVDNIDQRPGDLVNDIALSFWPDKLKWPWRKTDPPPKSTKTVKIWIPSLTKISFQVAWWGYRLWLPPPVMAVLGDKSIEAAKRAAMVTTAIGWIIQNIPTAMLPPPLQPAVMLLKAIVPYLGYISGFIAWSWGEVKSFDKGNGVVLSATWLLPIALIPSAWEDQGEKLPGVGTGTEKPVPAPNNPAPSDPIPSNPTPANPAPANPSPPNPTPAEPPITTPANPPSLPTQDGPILMPGDGFPADANTGY